MSLTGAKVSISSSAATNHFDYLIIIFCIAMNKSYTSDFIAMIYNMCLISFLTISPLNHTASCPYVDTDMS